MADTQTATGLRVQQWDDKFFKEYLTENRFAESMGTDELSVIQVREDLTKKKGDSITFSLVNALTGAGVTGSAVLEGQEEDMTQRSFRLYVDKRRNGVRVSEMEAQKNAIDLRNAGKSVLKDWSMKNTESKIITALGSINGTAYSSASEANKDAWLVDNADRVLFGAAKSNNSSNDHSASLANLDTTNDLVKSSSLSLLKTMARTANPAIRPIRSEASGRYYYIVYVGPRGFYDLQSDATITQAQREVQMLAENERLFKGGDLMWNGLIIKEVPEIGYYDNVGASSADVEPVYLCGAQAIGHGIAKRWKSAEETFDYGDKMGVAIEAIDGFAKLTFGSGAADTDDLKDHGVATGYFAVSAATA